MTQANVDETVKQSRVQEWAVYIGAGALFAAIATVTTAMGGLWL